MYLEYYGLKEPPFSITPDPRFVFLSERHRDALAHLLFGIDKGGGGGFVQLTGEVGTGKTTLCRLLLEQLPDNTRVALVLNPRQTPLELLETICEELHLDLDSGDGRGKRGSAKALVDALNAYLLEAYAQGLRVVLIVDEAQDLSIEALEQVRLLTNLETDTQKLLQVILLGQPELRTLLARGDLRQLAQRITARFHLTPLDAAETERYLRHRHAVAGGVRLPFDKAAIARLHRHAGGVPRLLNVLAERSLLAGYARDEAIVGTRLVDLAAAEALPPARPRTGKARPIHLALALLAAMLLVAAFVLLRREPPAPAPFAKVAPAAAAAAAAPVPRPVAIAPDADALAQRIATAVATPLAAWQALLSLWDLPTAAADVAIAAQCAPVLAPGVHCLRARADLDTLAAIGRPVLLRLRGPDRDGWALLLGADARRVRLRLGDALVDAPRVALPRAWTGEYAALWRTPPEVAAPVPLRDAGPATAWVRARLAAASVATAAPDDSAASDLGQAVRAFQAAQGLASDGVVGPETLFALAARDPGPHLLPALD
ncbi:AAA family ATPase [Luteimonas sp. 50]|uniref:AAA family ATPase n=1 Tax=Cognatiluteimonas sedimenti TaxID=2927791 RepID=A0ABT0A2M4_9GAMM|nr:ExeA family protein [Lysobacter sedimenti]MCJ0825227.1 AAA family ATPase [Lysobacter sedimenti]